MTKDARTLEVSSGVPKWWYAIEHWVWISACRKAYDAYRSTHEYNVELLDGCVELCVGLELGDDSPQLVGESVLCCERIVLFDCLRTNVHGNDRLDVRAQFAREEAYSSNPQSVPKSSLKA